MIKTMDNKSTVSIKDLAKINKSWIVLTVFVSIVLFILGLSGYIIYSPSKQIYQGMVEISELRISGKIPGRISRFRVNEGDIVKKGDTLVDIYSPEVLAKELQAQAGDELSYAIQKKFSGNNASELKNIAMNAWIGAKEALEVGQKSFERAEKLFQQGVISAQKYDEAKAKLSALSAAEKMTKEQYNITCNSIFSGNKDATKALVDKSQGLLKEVEAYLKEQTLLSPIDGVVTDIFPKEGELVGSGAPIMHIANKNEVKVVFTVREDNLKLFQKNKIIKGKVLALQKDIELKITKHKDLGIYAVEKSTKNNEGIDYRNFEVTAIPTNEIQDLESGMSVIIYQ